ncbi:MAG TPA: chain length determinant protein EpsF [Rhodocyclaceae bacterium]|jgi:chain length determinant protein EpsF|nr:chain length determinant protein EpsF [Rhodocyclaceae bacterium]
MTLEQFFLILIARRKLVGIIFASILGLALLVTLIMPNQYTATTSVVVDVKSPDPIAGVVLSGMLAPGYMTTQADIIQSERVAQRVVKLLKLDESPNLRKQWESDTDGQGTLVSWIANRLERKLDVKPSRDSNVVSINYAGSDPAMAAQTANAFAQAYIDTTIELRVDPARQYADWFDGQLKQQRDRLEKAQQALSNFQQQHGIVATDNQMDYETQRLNDLSSQLTQVETQGTDSSSKQKATNPETLAEVVQNPLINDLKQELAKRESKLQELSATLGVNHPQYQSALADVNESRARLRKEIGVIAASIATSSKVSTARAQDLRAALEQQKAKMLELHKQSAEMSVLQRDVESAQTAFDAVSQRMTQTRLEAQSAQTNVSILTPATQPLKPSRPRVLVNLGVGAFVGMLAGIAAALIIELAQRRIRSAEYLGEVIGVPVLVELDSTVPPERRLGLRHLLPFGGSGRPALMEG